MALLQALIDMAHTLNLSVVAEGVETLEQMEMLRSLRCNEMQGFLLARPQDPEQMQHLLLSPDQAKSTQLAEDGSMYPLPGFA